jgi:hypothetical protein
MNLHSLLCATTACTVLASIRPAYAQWSSKSHAPCDETWAQRDTGNEPPQACKVSVVLSPYHAAFPMLFVSTEMRVARRFGVSADTAFGSYRSATGGQLGVRCPFYVFGSFDGGLELGPFARTTIFHYGNANSLSAPPTGGGHEAIEVIYHDVEFARANGRDALFTGMLIGGKYVVEGSMLKELRGLTLQAGFLFGYHHIFGPRPYPPDPDAARTHDGFLSELYMELGWSF